MENPPTLQMGGKPPNFLSCPLPIFDLVAPPLAALKACNVQGRHASYYKIMDRSGSQ